LSLNLKAEINHRIWKMILNGARFTIVCVGHISNFKHL